jgi:hypothetical protein
VVRIPSTANCASRHAAVTTAIDQALRGAASTGPRRRAVGRVIVAADGLAGGADAAGLGVGEAADGAVRAAGAVGDYVANAALRDDAGGVFEEDDGAEDAGLAGEQMGGEGVVVCERQGEGPA